MKLRLTVGCLVMLLVSSLLGGVLGSRVQEDGDKERQALKQFTEILSLAEENYAQETDSEELIGGAIRGMLRNLDPHSNFLDVRTFRSMREEQKGSFSGLGIVVTKKGDLLTVISPIEGTPAYRMGIRAGDIISHIEGEPTESLHLDEAVSRLKGKKGSEVNISIKRFGVENPIPMTIVRDEIPTKSITKSFMLTPEVGYVRIKNFTRSTSDELDEALADLSNRGMEKLILDLRLNPGGLLEQAVKVTGKFIRRGQIVVKTKGRTEESNNIYRDEYRGEYFDKPLIVMVNRASASASEILAGAIQDHDRGLVIGETTWGKGLVQSVFPLRYGAGLALTTARYYTASGRCIQRDYSSWEDYYSPDEVDLNVTSGVEGADAFWTDTGRPVFSGGGIRPDFIIKPEPLSNAVEKLFEKDLFFKFAIQFSASHPDLRKDFAIHDEEFAAFKALAGSNAVELEDEAYEENRAEIETRIRWQVSAARLWNEESYKLEAAFDSVLQQALQHFPEAQELMSKAASMIAMKEQGPDSSSSPGTETKQGKSTELP